MKISYWKLELQEREVKKIICSGKNEKDEVTWQKSLKEVFQTVLKMPGLKAKSWEFPPKKISGKSHENWLS